MSEIIVAMEDVLQDVVLLCTMLMELFGVCVLVYTAVKCFWRWLHKDSKCRLELAAGIQDGRRGAQNRGRAGMVRAGNSRRHYSASRTSDIPDTLGNQKRTEGTRKKASGITGSFFIKQYMQCFYREAVDSAGRDSAELSSVLSGTAPSVGKVSSGVLSADSPSAGACSISGGRSER